MMWLFKTHNFFVCLCSWKMYKVHFTLSVMWPCRSFAESPYLAMCWMQNRTASTSCPWADITPRGFRPAGGCPNLLRPSKQPTPAALWDGQRRRCWRAKLRIRLWRQTVRSDLNFLGYRFVSKAGKSFCWIYCWRFLSFFFFFCKMCVTAAAVNDTTAETSESVRAAKADTDSQTSFNADGDKGQPSTPQLLPERCTEALSPPKTPSSVSLAESTQSASHSEYGEYLENQFTLTLFPTGIYLALSDANVPEVCH